MRIQDVVLVVKDVHDFLGPRQFPVKVTDVKRYITDRLGIEVEVFDKGSWQAKQIMGRLYRYEKGGRKWAKIIVSDSLNLCWGRFVACKELAHLIIDNSENDLTSDPIALIRNLVENPFVNIATDIHSEKLAVLAATELLIPWARRNEIYAMAAASKSNYEIATELKVPEKVVEWWRSDHYQQKLSDAWSGI